MTKNTWPAGRRPRSAWWRKDAWRWLPALCRHIRCLPMLVFAKFWNASSTQKNKKKSPSITSASHLIFMCSCPILPRASTIYFFIPTLNIFSTAFKAYFPTLFYFILKFLSSMFSCPYFYFTHAHTHTPPLLWSVPFTNFPVIFLHALILCCVCFRASCIRQE